LVAAVSAFRRAAPGTGARARARAYMWAFGARDSLFALFLAYTLAELVFTKGEGSLVPALDGVDDYVPMAATVLFSLLLAYGVLRTQLFDIDLKIKVGISRSTVVTVILVIALAAAKTAEFYLNRTYGYVAGGMAAGFMLFLAPRLNKMGDRVAATALPKADGSADYIATRKAEVYRAAVETAWEDGAISMQDRAILDRLREKLELTGPEAYGVEADVSRLLRVGATPAAAPVPAT
jgi:hypothetical protein